MDDLKLNGKCAVCGGKLHEIDHNVFGCEKCGARWHYRFGSWVSTDSVSIDDNKQNEHDKTE